MNSRLAVRSLVATLALFAAVHVAVAADAENGRKLAYACMGCHGIEHYKNAYPKYSVPKLGGQSETYIVAALAEYDSKARWHPTMQGYAATLTAEDRADIAAWFSSVSKRDPDAKTVGTAPAAAEACAACHGADGVGTLPENPSLAGQHADYLARALDDYRLGKRTNPIMGAMAQALTHDDMRAIAAYFAQQKGLTTPEL